MPRGSSQRQSPWGTLSILEEMKAAFCRCEARCLKLLCFGPKSFLGTKSLISSASDRKHTAACQAPSPGGPPARWHSAQLRGTEAPVAGVRERVVFIMYRWEFFSSETRFQGSSSFEVRRFDFSPAASSKLSTKGWQRREGISEELSSNSLRARPSLQSELPNRDLEMTQHSRRQAFPSNRHKTILPPMGSPPHLLAHVTQSGTRAAAVRRWHLCS